MKTMNKEKTTLITLILGIGVLIIEWVSFGNYDISDFFWLSISICLTIFFIIIYVPSKSFTSESIFIFGIICWFFWKFLNSIFQSRSGEVIGLFNIITYPMRQIFHIKVVDLLIYIIIFLISCFNIWGTHLIIQHFRKRRFSKDIIYWSLFSIFVILITIYSYGQTAKGICYGINGYTDNLICIIQENVSLLFLIWTNIVIIFCILTNVMKQAQFNEFYAYFWFAILEPVIILILFNPSRILGVLALKSVRAFEPYAYTDMIIHIMRIENMIILSSFFIVIPIGIVMINSKKKRVIYTISLITITFTLIWGFMQYALTNFNYDNTYILRDKFFFLLMVLELWLPIILLLFFRKLYITSPIKEQAM